MRVHFGNVSEFVAELKANAGCLFGRTVRIMVDREPLQREAITYAVRIYCTAVVVADDDTAYLIEYAASSPESVDAAEVDEYRLPDEAVIREVCGGLGLSVSGGRFEL